MTSADAARRANDDALVVDTTLDKRYGRSEVLLGAQLAVRAGTVHALVGENGAGKSTLVRILAGVVRADRGRLAIAGASADVGRWDRAAARAAGIGIVQQHGASAPTLSVVENAMLGVEGGPWLRTEDVARALVATGTRVGLPLDPYAAAGSLSLGAAQRAEIVAALLHGTRVLVLDEPTAVLTPAEVDGLLATLRALADAGTSVVFVTHKLDEVRAVADDVTVLRAGRTVATFGGAGHVRGTLDVQAIARAMVGADLPAPGAVARPARDARVTLAVTDVALGALRGVSLTVRAGELVGVAGVDGNGQRELAAAIAGLASIDRGTIAIGGRDVSRASPAARLRAGFAHVPEDRLHGGLWLDATIADNLALGRADVTGRWRIDRAAVDDHARVQIAALDVRPADPRARVRSLSGGNQQKVVVGRELSRPGLVAVVASQPTRGVDLGAVVRIHDQLRAAARAGAGVLVISADLDELLAVCHRVVVLLRGRLVGECVRDAEGFGDARAQLGVMMTGAMTDATDTPERTASGAPASRPGSVAVDGPPGEEPPA